MYPRRACSNPRNDARLFYFAAALPTVGFVHGAADLNPLDEAAPESNVEIIEHRHGIPFLHRQRSGSPHDVGGRWSCGGRIAATHR